VGRWTAEYVLLRGLGRTNIFPGDDVGARNNLQRWLHLAGPLDYAGVRRTLARWQRFGGLIYFHLLLDRLEEAGYLQTGTRQRPSGGAHRKAVDAPSCSCRSGEELHGKYAVDNQSAADSGTVRPLP
jgi:hypothetical protein